ncbi:putative 5'-_3' exoribonuclease [Heracleum sosnowskyi]|uniref:5'-3' exoribonuclease n=1 Tax=Heracleum sosnowskyi TaxID=360622 RepID=A0AAD8MRP1_9APIA|nr:putative 5'->3' exoribonuclease [Heracleum sosnowskyi]
MGVPAFYRWLTNKYESIVVNAKEENGESVDSSLPNPNGMEFDHLYLDMNGIIHPCFHPEDNTDMGTPKTFDEVFNNIFGYIDRLFNIVRPRRLLYLAIDGVAPRAKMNQQRTRRFRTAKDAEEMEKEEERLRRQFQLEGKQVLPKQETELSDSNIITPGTEFMFELSKKLQSYIRLRIKHNPGWKNVKVLLSDTSVPGEGEHKIFSFIRLQRTFPEYDAHTRHCVYGLDADLIMLALATHEIHFSILREDIVAQLPSSRGHSFQAPPTPEPENMVKSRGWFKKWGETGFSEISSSEALIKPTKAAKITYQFLHSWILREYLEIDLHISDRPENFEPDFERLIDDFIFICFFSGNDFIPRMPSLYIHEGGIDLLMHTYRKEFKNLGGYLVDMQRVDDKKSGYIKLKRVEKFILLVGNYEEQIFKKRADLRDRKLRKILNEFEDSSCAEDKDLGVDEIDFSTMKISGTCFKENCTSSNGANDPEVILQNTRELKEKLKANIRKAADSFQNGGPGTDKVKLNLPGYKERYYKEKFGVTSSLEIESTRKALVAKYTEGLCWVTLYYFAGVPSWTWYFPYNYGPFASDMKGLSHVKPKFQSGLPFKPFEQLMGVLPPRSAHALPLPYRRLMTDENSSIIDFYPTDFPIDVDGTRFTWQGVCKLPFIEEDRLLAETRKLDGELKANEAIRNFEGLDLLFLERSQIICNIQSKESNKHGNEVKIDADLSDGLNGFVLHKRDGNEADRVAYYDDNILCVFYKLPPHRKHNPRLLEGVIVPKKTITEADIQDTQLWHEYQGYRPNTRIQNPHRQWKPDEKLRDPTPAMIMKGGGIGWAGGRGKFVVEEAKKTSSAQRDSNFGPNSMARYGTPHNFKHNNHEKWRPSGLGRATRVTAAFKPNEPQIYNMQQDFIRADARNVEKARSIREINDARGSKNPGNRERCRAGAYVPSHSANNNVWQEKGSARVTTQNSWTTTSNRRANKKVWQETDSDIEECDVGHVEQLAEKFTKQLEGSKKVRKCSSFKQPNF